MTRSIENFGRLAVAFVGLAAVLATVPEASMAQSAASSQTVTMVDVENTRNMRFCEVLMINEGNANIYNTTGMSDCPEDAWSAIDPAAMARQMGVEGIQKNGPHFWVMDSQTLGLGETKTFNGIQARWAAEISATFLSGSEGSAPYEPFKACKTQKMVYDAGQKVWEMVDDKGQVWVLQAHEAQFSLDDLDTLDTQMKSFPDGWSWRTRTLDEQLVLDLKAADCNMGIGDEFHQYYTLEPVGE
jgi:hypothetical protein